MMRRIATGGIALMLLWIVMDCLGLPWLPIGDALLLGWVHVANRAAPAVEINYIGIATGFVCIAATVLMLHLFGSWIYREVRAKQGDTRGPSAWRWKWTLCLLAALLLMFLAGLVGVGLFRTTSWFLESPRYFENKRIGRW